MPLPCFLLQAHRSCRSAVCTSAQCTSSSCENADMGPLKKEKARSRPVSWALCGRSPWVYLSGLAQVRHQGIGMATTLPGAGTSGSASWCVGFEASKLGKHLELNTCLHAQPSRCQHPVWLSLGCCLLWWYSRKGEGTYTSLDIHWNVCNSPRIKIIVHIFLSENILDREGGQKMQHLGRHI